MGLVLKLLSSLLTVSKLSAWIRHGLTALAGILVYKGYITADTSGDLIESIMNVLSERQVLEGITTWITAMLSSKVNSEKLLNTPVPK